MKRSVNKMPAPKADVVPIINVSLVVVLTLMVISPFLNQPDLEVDLPDATTTETEDQDKIEIIFTRAGEISVDDRSLTLDELQPVLSERFALSPSSMAVVKADQGIPYGQVEAVIAAIQKAGAPRIALATEQAGGEATQ
jgi:biopolymer transport protein ExbD